MNNMNWRAGVLCIALAIPLSGCGHSFYVVGRTTEPKGLLVSLRLAITAGAFRLMWRAKSTRAAGCMRQEVEALDLEPQSPHLVCTYLDCIQHDDRSADRWRRLRSRMANADRFDNSLRVPIQRMGIDRRRRLPRQQRRDLRPSNQLTRVARVPWRRPLAPSYSR